MPGPGSPLRPTAAKAEGREAGKAPLVYALF